MPTAVYSDAMDWTAALLWPATVLLVAAALFALLALLSGIGTVRHWRRRRRGAACWRGAWLLVFALVALVLAAGGVALRGYHALTGETAVAQLHAQALAPQRWQLTLQVPGGERRRVLLAGDAFRIEARVVKWRLPALLAGAPPVYRLDRLSGRYDDVGQALEAQRTVVALAAPHALDLWTLERRFPQWLPAVDAAWGSGAYMPLVDNGNYRVTLAAAGGLVARPADAATARAISARR
ncbi:MAG TPA: hypothetical protein VFG73_01610 [Rhodanobacteraceae bacterium]|nr:hypothetical protein [Rhodanobacteraceae bacterium]